MWMCMYGPMYMYHNTVSKFIVCMVWPLPAYFLYWVYRIYSPKVSKCSLRHKQNPSFIEDSPWCLSGWPSRDCYLAWCLALSSICEAFILWMRFVFHLVYESRKKHGYLRSMLHIWGISSSEPIMLCDVTIKFRWEIESCGLLAR